MSRTPAPASLFVSSLSFTSGSGRSASHAAMQPSAGSQPGLSWQVTLSTLGPSVPPHPFLGSGPRTGTDAGARLYWLIIFPTV